MTISAATRSLKALPAKPDPARAATPFASAQEAWLWTMAALIARREGARYSANKGTMSRPCDPDDVVRCLDAL